MTNGGDILFNNERLMKSGVHEFLVYSRSGDRAKPLVVFIPGSSHLARVAYGHPGAIQSDFIDHWLGEQGYSFCAISYPIAHPVFPEIFPEMSVDDWGRGTAEVLNQAAGELDYSGEIVVMLWSMAGRVIHRFTHHARCNGFHVKCFISLAATAPLVGLAPLDPAFLRLTDAGLRDTSTLLPDGSSYDNGLWGHGIHFAEQTLGRPVISDEDYYLYYRGDHPIQLRGEADRLSQGILTESIEAAISDAGLFDFRNFALTASIIPNSLEDARHCLTDKSVWGFFNTQHLFKELSLPPDGHCSYAADVRDLFDHHIQSLTRRINGNHFFFVGEHGAKTTIQLTSELIKEIDEIKTRHKSAA